MRHMVLGVNWLTFVIRLWSIALAKRKECWCLFVCSLFDLCLCKLCNIFSCLPCGHFASRVCSSSREFIKTTIKKKNTKRLTATSSSRRTKTLQNCLRLDLLDSYNILTKYFLIWTPPLKCLEMLFFSQRCIHFLSFFLDRRFSVLTWLNPKTRKNLINYWIVTWIGLIKCLS